MCLVDPIHEVTGQQHGKLMRLNLGNESFDAVKVELQHHTTKVCLLRQMSASADPGHARLSLVRNTKTDEDCMGSL